MADPGALNKGKSHDPDNRNLVLPEHFRRPQSRPRDEWPMIPPAYYLVLDFGRLGRESVINWEDCSREAAVLRILHGDYGGRLLEVHCIDRDAMTWMDVTEEIARDVWDRLEDHPSPPLVEFLEEKLGLVRGLS